MQYIRTKILILTVIVVLVPSVTIADTGGLLELWFVTSLVGANLFWPILLPIFFLRSAKKKLSLYAYSVIICGLIDGLLTYVLPRQLASWGYSEPTIESLRILAVGMVFGTVLAVFLSLRIIPRIREFNDTHD